MGVSKLNGLGSYFTCQFPEGQGTPRGNRGGPSGTNAASNGETIQARSARGVIHSIVPEWGGGSVKSRPLNLESSKEVKSVGFLIYPLSNIERVQSSGGDTRV